MIDNNEELLLEDLSIPIPTFSEFRKMNESFHNFMPSDANKKTAHSVEVFSLIKKAYASQGGIQGSGFKTPDDMVKNIPMWKLSKKDGKVNAVALYKDKNGRKRVATSTDGSPEGKKAAGEIVTGDLRKQRAHMEVSGKSLSFLKKLMPIKDHLHSYESAEKFHASQGDTISRPAEDDPEVVRHPELKNHMYVRNIGGENHTKVMIGTMGKTITEAKEEALTKEQEIENGTKSALKPKIHSFGNWNMDPQIHGPSQAYVRRPDMTSDHWQDMLQRSHEALTNPTTHLGKPAKVTSGAVLVYSKKHQQGVILRIDAKNKDSLKQGGNTRIETVLPKKHSLAQTGTQRIVIEGVEYSLEDNLIFID